MLLWAKGLALGLGLDAEVDEPDVWPLAIQGPQADELAARIFGDAVREIEFFRFTRCAFDGHDFIVARAGFSKQGGFEVYVEGFEHGAPLWDALWQAGADLNLEAGYPNLIERIEGGLLSYGNEMTRENNPLECNLERYCSLDGSVDYIGRAALERIAADGPTQRIRGLRFDGEPCPPCQHPWPLMIGARQVGYVTSATWSPRFEANVALAMLERDAWQAGTGVEVRCGDGTLRNGLVTGLPMEEK